MRYFTLALPAGGRTLEDPGQHPGQDADASCFAPVGAKSASRSVRPAVTGGQYQAQVAQDLPNRALTGASTDASRREAGDAEPP